MVEDIRWKQRFQNFEKAFLQFKEFVQSPNYESYSILEKQGVVQQYEIISELSWKVLKDYLQEQGLNISPLTPKNVIKEAFQARVIDDGEIWIEIIAERNILAHVYDEQRFKAALKRFKSRYFVAFEKLYETLKSQV